MEEELSELSTLPSNPELATEEIQKAAALYQKFQELTQTYPDDFRVSVSVRKKEDDISASFDFASLETRAIVQGTEYDVTLWLEGDDSGRISECITVNRPQPPPTAGKPLVNVRYPECEIHYSQPEEGNIYSDSLGVIEVEGRGLTDVRKIDHHPSMDLDEALAILDGAMKEGKFSQLLPLGKTPGYETVSLREYQSMLKKGKRKGFSKLLR